MLNKIYTYFRYKLNKLIHPEIIGGYCNADGRYVSRTRISNMSHLSNKKNIQIEDNVFIGHFNYIDGHCPVYIGEGVQITNHISILTHSSHHSIRLLGEHYLSQSLIDNPCLKGTIEIGDYTFIGAHATVMPGTRIGKGSLVAAYSYVQGEFPDYSIIKGQPGKVVGSTKEVDRKLLEEKPELEQFYYD